MDGRGLMTWKDGRTYTGEFKCDMLHGRGVMRWPGGIKLYDGEWKNGIQHGLGYVCKNNLYKYGILENGTIVTPLTKEEYL